MKPYERLDETVAPDGSVLTLYRHDGAYLIRVGAIELMSTRRHQSEDRLAELACAPYATVPGAAALIGGLGFGFTLRAALGILPADARVVVAELVEGVIRWNLEPSYGLAADALADRRVELRHLDVHELLRTSVGAFDAIMLDVDNGAEALVTRGNARLYDDAGIRLAAQALRPGGRVAYWSADEDRRFATALRRAGLTVEVARVRAHGGKGAVHWVYLGRRR